MKSSLMNIYWYLFSAIFWPLLMWQGQRLRKVAVRLPEAAGPRQGELGSEPFFAAKRQNILICGDSAAAGVGILCQQQALSGQLISALTKVTAVKWQLVAKSGINCTELVELLQQLPQQPFDAVFVSIGVNNVTALTNNARYQQQLQALLKLLAEQFQAKQIIISAIPPMQHFSALPWPLNHWLGIKARLLNQVLAKELQRWPQACMVATAIPVSADMLAADGFHPSVAGTAVWVDLLLSHYKRPQQ